MCFHVQTTNVSTYRYGWTTARRGRTAFTRAPHCPATYHTFPALDSNSVSDQEKNAREATMQVTWWIFNQNVEACYFDRRLKICTAAYPTDIQHDEIFGSRSIFGNKVETHDGILRMDARLQLPTYSPLWIYRMRGGDYPLLPDHCHVGSVALRTRSMRLLSSRSSLGSHDTSIACSVRGFDLHLRSPTSPILDIMSYLGIGDGCQNERRTVRNPCGVFIPYGGSIPRGARNEFLHE